MQLTRGMLGKLGHHCRTKWALSGYHGGKGYGFGLSAFVDAMTIDEEEEADDAVDECEETEEIEDNDEDDGTAVVVSEGPATGVEGPAVLWWLMLPLVIGMFGEAESSCIKLFERLLSSSPSTSGSESVSTNRGKMNFFLRVREGGTR